MIKRILLTLFVIFSGFAIYIFIYVFTGIVFPWDKKDAIATTIEWGGLTALPVDESDLSVRKTGSPFTRQYIIEFEAPEAKVAEWLNKNKHLKVHPFIKKPGYKIYSTPGQNGAIGGFVEISKSKVIIKMSWS